MLTILTEVNIKKKKVFTYVPRYPETKKQKKQGPMSIGVRNTRHTEKVITREPFSRLREFRHSVLQPIIKERSYYSKEFNHSQVLRLSGQNSRVNLRESIES